MYVKLPDTDSTKWYNLTIENKSGTEGMFMTKYTPNAHWLNNKSESYQGGIQTSRMGNITHEFPTSGGGDNDPTTTTQGSPWYPTDCTGYVFVRVEEVAIRCQCVTPGHLPNECVGECDFPGYYDYVPMYYCVDTNDGTGTSNPNSGNQNPNNGLGGDDGENPDNSPSIGATILPVDCTAMQSHDPDLPCYMSPYEICRTNGNSVAVCNCQAGGGVLEDCIFEENISIEQLTSECANNIVRNSLFGDSEPVITNLISEINNIFWGDTNVTLAFTNDDISGDVNAASSFDVQAQIDSGVYDIFITLSNTYLDGNPTKLSIALTLIHEIVHAKLMYAYLHDRLIVEYPEYIDLQESLDTFMENRTEENGQAINDEMHNAMVNFISDMAYALFKYAEKVGMENITQQYCTDIVKGSFYNTPAMDLIDTGANTPEDLNNMHVNEQDNNENAQGDDC